MENDPENASLRLRYYEQFARREIYLLLKSEPEGDRIDPQIVTMDDQNFILAFDTEARLASFHETPSPYAALNGRDIAAMLKGQGVGIGVNLGVAQSAFLIAADGVDWLNGVLDNQAQGLERKVETLLTPETIPENLREALARCLLGFAGFAQSACLVDVQYQDGTRAHLLAVIGADEPMKEAIGRGVAETLSFLEQPFSLDVSFFEANDSTVQRMNALGLSFAIPKPAEPQPMRAPKAPGMDPDKPPKLR